MEAQVDGNYLPEENEDVVSKKPKKNPRRKKLTDRFFIDLLPFSRFTVRRTEPDVTIVKGCQGTGLFAKFTSKNSHGASPAGILIPCTNLAFVRDISFRNKL